MNDLAPGIYDPATEYICEINENLRLIGRNGGLAFGTDSYLLAAFAAPRPGGSAVELGCGGGVVSLLCAEKRKFDRIVGVEIMSEYAALARRNAELNGLGGRIVILCEDIRSLTQSDVGGQTDAVLANPPYMLPGHGKDNGNSEMNAARRELNGGIADFCAAAGRILKTGGSFYVVWRPERLADLLEGMRAAGIEPKRMIPVCPYRNAPPSLVLAEGKRGSSPSLSISRTLTIYEERGRPDYTADAAKIYENCSTAHLFEPLKG